MISRDIGTPFLDVHYTATATSTQLRDEGDILVAEGLLVIELIAEVLTFSSAETPSHMLAGATLGAHRLIRLGSDLIGAAQKNSNAPAAEGAP